MAISLTLLRCADVRHVVVLLVRQRLTVVSPRCVPGLQALHLLCLGDHSEHRWHGCKVDVPFIQLTTLDEHLDAKQVTIVGNK